VRVPASLLALPLTAGSAAGLLAAGHARDSLALCAAAAALVALLAAIAAFGTDDTPLGTVSLVTGALLAGISLGLSAGVSAYEPPLLRWFASASGDARSSARLAGTIREDAALTPTGVALVLDLTEIAGVATSGGIRLSVGGTLAPSAMREWRAGRCVRLVASLRRPTAYRNPGVPDETGALARRGIVLVGSVTSAGLVELGGRGSRVAEWAAGVRARVRSTLAASVGVWSERSAGVAAAIAIGDRTGLSQDDERRLQEAGTYHVIAISGGNIAILTVLLLAALRLCWMPARVAAGLTILALVCYGRITGPSPSVDRAIAAAIVFLAGRMLEERGPSINVLATAGVLGVAVSPVAVFDHGFVLSFGATLGILVGVPRMLSSMPSPEHADGGRRFRPGLMLNRVWRGAAAMAAATAAAEAVLVPVAATLFARVTFAGLLLNFVAIPMMAVVQAGALATLLTSVFDPALARGCGYVVHLAATALVRSARLVDAAPWLSVDVVPPAWGVVATYYVSLILGLSSVRFASIARLMAASTGVVIVLGPHATARDGVPLPSTGTMRVVFLDVGQGDSTLIRLPDARAFLVDAGGLPAAPLQDPLDGPAFDVGDRVVSRALRALGLRSIDTLVVTHGDADHTGGAPSVLRRFAPRAVWEGVPVPPLAARAAFLASAEALGAEWRTVQAGDRLRVGGVELDVLHPPLPEWERQRVRNDDSVVLALRFGRVQIVLPGDIGREGEAGAAGRLRDAAITVLKAPHHGSATSSTPAFLSATRPDVVVFSAGRDNRFGHPAAPVVARYQARGAVIFSTATDGAVILDTDGETVQIRGWSSGRAVSLGGRR
jgi:competence protein ComEC